MLEQEEGAFRKKKSKLKKGEYVSANKDKLFVMKWKDKKIYVSGTQFMMMQ